ncbi:DsbE family thiol:disulfide interchange protein [endosymbiont of Ridgeia piscesae]|jgi:cytochrome c biogenesis protein CcmG/thiol:disulfide interchange protein DsbE|uniref:Cytochrome c biogenesis protein CcmG, thiol:disulfide interchange protein DsbE n=1 Tax=endosymbiont of Ridgeia piscesae TaxID=54398 RepID=A0A0T5Z6M0_9GAMM|nr:DsbE family thiol:disulfide interchange protein [endosymbiont of Ridgeia piscesae]KRT56406.1 periplasmic protein thiol:disulfide oxidoreductase, DsbE subfamily [endosymbiont of Ridgeia piscesae]KRT58133.1 cytochrome c biogenesis protein CcmG, thiol:disulfide interchange protein DsbE [endosymbiont of Ridgeia piscesae]
MGRYLRFLIPLAIFAVIAAFLFKGLDMNPREIPSPLIGKQVPEFSLPSLRDPAVMISDKDLRGKVYLLNVWATWCVSCRAEHKTLVQLSRMDQVEIYGLNWKDDRAGALTWLQQLGDPYMANIFDKKGRTAIDLGVYGAPETFVVDANGIIRYKYAGPLSIELIREQILPLVKKLKQEGGA